MGIGRVAAQAGGSQERPVTEPLASGHSVTWLLGIGALLTAAVAGTLIAAAIPLGVGFVAAICIGLAAAVNLPLALAVWVGILFVRYLPGRECRHDVRSAGHRRRLARHAPCPPVRCGRSAGAAQAPAGLARGDGAVGVAVAPLEQESGKRRSGALALVCGHAHLPGAHHDHLYTGAGSHDSLGLPPRSTGVGRRRHASGDLESSSDAIEGATATEGRLQGGGGDPNFLAAGLIPAVGLAGR